MHRPMNDFKNWILNVSFNEEKKNKKKYTLADKIKEKLRIIKKNKAKVLKNALFILKTVQNSV